jgi:hypothetical protein
MTCFCLAAWLHGCFPECSADCAGQISAPPRAGPSPKHSERSRRPDSSSLPSVAKTPICTAAPNEPNRPLSKPTRTPGLLSLPPCACHNNITFSLHCPALYLPLETVFLAATSATRPLGLLNWPNADWTNATRSVVPSTETRSTNRDAVGVSAPTTWIQCQFLSLVLALRGYSWKSMAQKTQKEKLSLPAMAQDSFHGTGG